MRIIEQSQMTNDNFQMTDLVRRIDSLAEVVGDGRIIRLEHVW